jgi:hypothetical protein
MTRIRCRAFACNPGNGPACERCGTDIYDPTFIEYGWDWPLVQVYWELRRWIRKLPPHRCDVCKRVYWRSEDDPVCSPECFDKWLPF